MNNPQHYETAPEDRIPFHLKLIYGLGAFVNNLLAAAIGGMVIVLNLGLGMNPALVGLVSALPRLTDAITDPLMGYISDNTRSRWGRRRPYIFVGAIAAAVIFALLWQLPLGKSESFYFWYFLVGSLIFYLAYTIYATPNCRRRSSRSASNITAPSRFRTVLAPMSRATCTLPMSNTMQYSG